MTGTRRVTGPPGLTGLVERIVEAHGGCERWRRTTEVELHLSSGGPAFAAKGRRRTLHEVTATVATDGQRVELRGSRPQPWRLRFDGADTFGLPALHRGRRRLAWSRADIGAFAAAALWTYVHVPFVLGEPSVQVELLGPWRGAGETWQRVEVTFPPSVATHCRRQVLYVDENHRVRRHDYTALAFGRWARAAQYLSAYEEFDGLWFPTRRRVHPRLPGGRPAPWPHLVWIDIHHVTCR